MRTYRHTLHDVQLKMLFLLLLLACGSLGDENVTNRSTASTITDRGQVSRVELAASSRVTATPSPTEETSVKTNDDAVYSANRVTSGGRVMRNNRTDELGDGRFIANHFVVDLPLFTIANATRQLIKSPRMAFGKNSFLTGFGLGFLAFGLKKLLLPIIIGVQIVKSVLVALFLPTILSHIGKLVGKGLTSVASQSGSSGTHDQVQDFEFKDSNQAASYDAEVASSDNLATWTLPAAQPSNAHVTLAALNPGRTPGSAGGGGGGTKSTQTIQERITPKLPSYQVKQHFGSFYSKDPQSDFKVFNKIPSSSHLLAHYDPFYSPLLSRLDSVFKQLGTTSEGCRERLVCDMYNNPAKFAPFSNLVSAQLSRELNELRKPSSDNPEILRFFRYMKAAKDGQDGSKCQFLYANCIAPTILSDNASPMVTTFNDINKLVQARKLE